MRNIWLIVAFMSGLVSATASGAAVIDVDNLVLPPPGTVGWGGYGADSSLGFRVGQNWTVTIGGTLQSIELVGDTVHDQGSADFNVTLSVFGGQYGSVGGGPLLGSLVRPASTVTALGITTFDFSALNIEAPAGQALSWEMSVQACNSPCFRLWENITQFSPSGVATPSYSGGVSYAYSPVIGFVTNAQDANFRISMASPIVTEPDPVPEPSTWAMALLGFGGVGFALRRRRLVLPRDDRAVSDERC